MKKLEWDLTDLFKSNEEFYEEIEKINLLIEDIKKLNNINIDDNETLLKMLNERWKIKQKANNILVYGSLSYYKNVNDNECIEMKNKAEKLNNDVNTVLTLIDLKIIGLGKEKILSFIKTNSKLEIYAHFLDNLFRLQEHIQDEYTTEYINNNKNHVNDELTNYNNLLKNIEYGNIEINGEMIEINSLNYRKFISSRDRETRKKTYLVVNGSFKRKQGEFSNILDSIYKLRIKNSQLENYTSVLEKVLYEENINPEIVDTLIKVVNENLNLIQTYLKQKSELLEINDPHLYDFDVSLDNDLKIKFSLDEAIEIIKKALEPLGEEYLNVVELLLNGHIDAELSKDKHQYITFSWHTYSFMNFRGAYIDLKNMVHEIGHIVNYYLSKQKQPFLYEDSTVFVGETASIVNEILLNKYLYNNAKTEKEKIFYLSKEIENYFTSVFKQTMYTEFENELYNLEKLTPDILCKKYDNITKKYYGNDIFYDDLSNIEWARLGHLYRWSYYPYKYATGLIIASIVVNSLIEEKTITQEQYLEFLSSGSNTYSLELLKILNIDLTNLGIITDGFKVLKKDINELNKVLVRKIDK